MNRIPVLWYQGTKGMWDHGIVAEFLNGTLYGAGLVPRDFDERLTRDHPGEGSVLVVCGGAYREQASTIVEHLNSYPWSVCILTSDEGHGFQWQVLPTGANRSTWVQYPCPGVHDLIPLRLPTGFRCDTRSTLQVARSVSRARDYVWSFAGQVQHEFRRECVRQAQALTRPGHLFVSNKGFASGYPYQEYVDILLRSQTVLCPAGSDSPDSFRVYEALEAGALPICDRRMPTWSKEQDYWQFLWGEQPPYPVVDHWSELPEVLNSVVGSQHIINRSAAWWIGKKRQMAWSLSDDITRFAGRPVRDDLRDRVTILMPSSPIPSHPSTDKIAEAIRQIRTYPEIAECEIIIMLDGVREEHQSRAADYAEYTRRLIDLCNWDPAFHGCLPLVFDRHTHQANMTRYALTLVRTPLIYFVEHDFHPFGEIPFTKVCDVVQNRSDVNYVCFNWEHEISPYRLHMYLDKDPRDVDGLPMIRAIQWSQQPHIAKTEWYRWIIHNHFGVRARAMIENVMYGVVARSIQGSVSNWLKWGTWVYTPPGSIRRSFHLDGRETDPPLPQINSYDGPVPLGAPPADIP